LPQRWLGFALIAAALLVIAPCARAEDCRLGLAASVPMTDTGRRLLVPASIDGHPVTMVVDTGGEISELTPDALARDKGARTYASSVMSIQGVGEAVSFADTRIPHFAIGRLVGRVDVMPALSDFGHRVDGLLSAGALGGRYDLDVDIAGGRLGYYTEEGRCQGVHVALSPPLYGVPLVESGRDVVPVVSVVIGGRRLRAMLDTGAEMSLISAEAAGRVGAALGPEIKRGQKIMGIDGVLQTLPVHLIDRIDFGPIGMLRVPAVVAGPMAGDFEVILGLDFFRRVHLWISRSQGMVVMQYPPAATPQ
jgi:predicted aspartyl protease